MIQLTLEQIRSVTCGAERVTHEDGAFHFYRFTPQQMRLYKENSEDGYIRSFHTSGVKLRFRTDSRNLFMAVDTSHVASRHYFSFSVLVNGEMIGSLKNFTEEELFGHYAQKKFAHQPLSGTFALGDGEKEVCIYLPWSCAGEIECVGLDDGSWVEPVKWNKRLFAFGDSITHGYDARYPQNKYISRLAEALDAEEFNKAIGGEVFFPALADTEEAFAPDYIVVAYGTNDWSKTSGETLRKNSRAFYETISARYPEAVIFALTPIWRGDHDRITDAGAFWEVASTLERVTQGLENVHVVHGKDLVPGDPSIFGDLKLHPSDQGFDCYFRNLYQKIQKFLPVAE